MGLNLHCCQLVAVQSTRPVRAGSELALQRAMTEPRLAVVALSLLLPGLRRIHGVSPTAPSATLSSPQTVTVTVARRRDHPARRTRSARRSRRPGTSQQVITGTVGPLANYPGALLRGALRVREVSLHAAA